jgi:site-specific DNA-cytosine methylase
VNDVAVRSIELFAGVGMLGEGLRAGLAHLGIEARAVCFVEREAHAASILVARMAEGSLAAAPVWTDVCTFNAAAWRGCVDFVVAGFPCQDLSVAGRRAGLDGKRSGLFFEVVRIATECGATGLFLENVAGIATATASVVDPEEGELDERAASRVVGELADLGWDAEWITLSASDVGASHGRARWFCLAWRTLANADDHECEGGRVPAAIGRFGQSDLGRSSADGAAGFAGQALEFASGERRSEGRAEPARQQGRRDVDQSGGAVADTHGCGSAGLGRNGEAGVAEHCDGVANAISPRPQERAGGGVKTMEHFNRPAGPTLPAFIEHSASSLPALQMKRGEESSSEPHGSPPPSPSKSSTTPRLLSRRLNPYFVELLMGWPAGWTSTTEPSASNALETAAFRSKLQSRLSCLLGEPGSSP